VIFLVCAGQPAAGHPLGPCCGRWEAGGAAFAGADHYRRPHRLRAGSVGGVPLAYLLARRSFPGKRLVEGLVDLPVVVPHTAAGIALLMVFGSKGVLGEPLASLGFSLPTTWRGLWWRCCLSACRTWST